MNDVKMTTVKEYIRKVPKEVREGFEELRTILCAAAPEAEEGISYGMPCLRLHGMLLYYACHAKHYGLYPYSETIVEFSEKLEGYETSKGTVKFPHDKKLPKKLITDMVKYRVKQSKDKVLRKSMQKRKA